MPNILFPPRPKGRIGSPKTDLPFYEQTGEWLGQRKFNGTATLIHITPEGRIGDQNRHGKPHIHFALTNPYVDEIRQHLRFDKGQEYWLHGEIMSRMKVKGAGEEIVFYDLLCAGNYFFGGPDQETRLAMLADICGNPKTLEPGRKAFQISERLWLAETFFGNFYDRFQESIPDDQLEGLVLRKRRSVLDHWGTKEYESDWLIRCRKPFRADSTGRSTKGYNF